MLVGNWHIVQAYTCSVQSSVASEFTNQKFAKTLSTFSCPYLISHSGILLIPPPLSNISSSKHWCMVCSKNICGNMYQFCYTFFCYHVVQNIWVLWCPYACLHIGGLAIVAFATWAAWFWAAQGRLHTKKKEERKGRKGKKEERKKKEKEKREERKGKKTWDRYEPVIPC